MFRRLSPALQRRLLFLTIGNVVLLGAIYSLLGEGASFLNVLTRSGPNVAPHVLAGLGLTGIICAGAIDLSIGAIIVVAGTVFGICFAHGAGPAVCYLACFFTAWGLSALNGGLIRFLKIPAIIVTLAGLTFYRGAALILADTLIDDFGGSLSVQDSAYHAPGKEYAGAILFVVVLIALLWEWAGKTPRTWLALGCSREACRLQGLAPGAILQSTFYVGGLFLGAAALVYATRLQVIEPARMARGFELEVIGAIILGGTNIFGGEGSYAGTVLGTFFLYFIGEALLSAGVNPYYQDAIRGGLIILVIGADCAMHRRRKRLDELR